jgi:hypothetical protein
MADFCFQMAHLFPKGAIGNEIVSHDDTGRCLTINATGSFVDVYFNEGRHTGSRVVSLSIYYTDEGFEDVIGFGIGRTRRALTQSDRDLVRYYGFHITHPTLQRIRDEAWCRMSFSDSRFMMI